MEVPQHILNAIVFAILACLVPRLYSLGHRLVLAIVHVYTMNFIQFRGCKPNHGYGESDVVCVK